MVLLPSEVKLYIKLHLKRVVKSCNFEEAMSSISLWPGLRTNLGAQTVAVESWKG